MTLNERAYELASAMAICAEDLRIAVHKVGGARVLDCGVATPGGLNAGLDLARVCLSGLADVSLTPGSPADLGLPQIQVISDQPVRACLASQYAGWQVASGSYFAMGSGPMRAAYGKEELFDLLGGREAPPVAVGVLETRKLPTEEVVAFLAGKLNLPTDRLTLLAAPTASLAGTVQVVARSLETALHKLFELRFDLGQVVSGYGTAPLPPVAADDLGAIGWTNDAILYGGRVALWVRADDEVLGAIGPKVPSSASSDHGAPFRDVFEHYHRDFYKIDPLLFSPAVLTFHNLKTGRTHTFGQVALDVLKQSFGWDGP